MGTHILRVYLTCSVLFAVLISVGRAQEQPFEKRGAEIYQARCAACHDTGLTPRAPPRASLAKLSSDIVYFAITSGVMRMQAAGLGAIEREAIFVDYGKFQVWPRNLILAGTGAAAVEWLGRRWVAAAISTSFYGAP
jgi:hypothetical protein